MSTMILRKAAKPLPLSCLFHIALFTVIGLFGRGYVMDIQQAPEAVVEFEMTQEELEEVKEIQHIDPPESMALLGGGAVESAVHQQAAEGSQAILSSDEAVAHGDGAVAAGNGSSTIAEGGSSFAAGHTGTGTGDTAGADSNVSTGSTVEEVSQPEPTESIGDIAGRFAARVEANKRYPSMAVRMEQQGVVVAYATLSADGSLIDYGISSSSGYDSLDNAALNAVAASCPFSHGAGSTITISVPIHFQLD